MNRIEFYPDALGAIQAFIDFHQESMTNWQPLIKCKPGYQRHLDEFWSLIQNSPCVDENGDDDRVYVAIIDIVGFLTEALGKYYIDQVSLARANQTAIQAVEQLIPH